MGNSRYFFKHDFNARSDEKTAALISEYGAQGYGIYWIIVEILHENENSSIEYSEKSLKRIAGLVRVKYDEFKKIIDDCIEVYELFYVQDGMVLSNRVNVNKGWLDSIKSTRQLAGAKGGKNRVKNEVSKQMLDEMQANACEKSSKIKQTQANTKQNQADRDKIREDKNIEANASVVPTDEFKNLKKDKVGLINFINTHKPTFIEPYFNLWNLWAEERNMPQVISITDKRKMKFRTRCSEKEFDFIKILTKASKSDMILTSASKWFSFDWILENSGNYLKVLEGNYDNRENVMPLKNQNAPQVNEALERALKVNQAV